MQEESQSQDTGAMLHMSSEDGRRLSITGMSLVDPAYVRGERVVNVWAEVGQEKRAIGKLSTKEPVVSVPPVVLAGEFVLRHDLTVAAAVRLNVRVLGPPESSSNVDEVEAVLVLGVNDVEEVAEEVDDGEADEAAAAAVVAGVEYEPMSEEAVAARYDSDNGEDDDVGGGASGRARESRKTRLVAAPAESAVVMDGEFLGPARFAVVGNTAGFMRIAAAAAAKATNGNGDQESSKEILVLYRYTRFSRARSGRRGVVEACRRTKLHRLRFAVPPAAAGDDMASALAWAGSSLGPLIYPGLFRQQLADLWTSLLLAAPAVTNAAILRRAGGRLQVIVDVGILRREDYTAERMVHMHGELVCQVLEPWPACYYHVVMELNLPELVPGNRRIAGDDDDEEDECCVCLEVLESGGLAAWPGCGHVFHGACVEKTLQRSEMCPLCRHRLSDPLVAKKHQYY